MYQCSKNGAKILQIPLNMGILSLPMEDRSDWFLLLIEKISTFIKASTSYLLLFYHILRGPQDASQWTLRLLCDKMLNESESFCREQKKAMEASQMSEPNSATDKVLSAVSLCPPIELMRWCRQPRSAYPAEEALHHTAKINPGWGLSSKVFTPWHIKSKLLIVYSCIHEWSNSFHRLMAVFHCFSVKFYSFLTINVQTLCMRSILLNHEPIHITLMCSYFLTLQLKPCKRKKNKWAFDASSCSNRRQ